LKAAVYRAPGVIAVEERDVPRIRDDEILVKIRAASICGTDLRIYSGGHFKIDPGVSRVLGHELAGEIVAVGSYVSGWTVGQRVSVAPNVGCGRCEMCRQGHNNMCVDYEAFGITFDGGFEQHMRVPAAAIYEGNLFEVPDSLTWEEAAVIEPLSCCYNAWKGLKVTPEDTVLIIGPGSIGVCFLQLAKTWGAKKVIMVGRRDSRLAEVERFGADVLINSTKTDVAREVERITGGRGVDVVITAASAPELQSLAIHLLARHGRVNFFAGLQRGTKVELDTNRLHYWGLQVFGTTGSSINDYHRALRLVEDRLVNVGDIISHRFSIDEAPDAFRFALSGQGMKSVVLPN
jgi:threonine dehydrogenase-like Zn-dependent dehydrogenase